MVSSKKGVSVLIDKRDRGEQILVSAYSVFGEKGFFTATMDSIAQHAGVAKGTLYLYYENKEELFQAVIGKILQDYFKGYEQLLIGSLPFLEKLIALVRYTLIFIRERAVFAKISIREAPFTEEFRLSMATYTKKMSDHFIAVLQEAYPGKFTLHEAYLAYLSFTNMGEGMISDVFRENRDLTDHMVEERAHFVAHLFVNGIERLPRDRECSSHL